MRNPRQLPEEIKINPFLSTSMPKSRGVKQIYFCHKPEEA